MGVEIIPAIMPESYSDLVENASRIKGVVEYAQIDVMDGDFTVSKSWPYGTEGQCELKEFLEKGEKLPFWDEVNYEVDLMVAHPEKAMHEWVALGVRRVIVHIESADTPRKLLTSLEEKRVDDGGYEGEDHIEFGLAFGIETPLDRLHHYMYDVDVVQLMGIAKIGYQGEPFDARVLARVRDLRAQYPHLIISVDGGVNTESAPQLIDAGVDRLVSGSAVFGSTNVREAISTLKRVTHT